MIYQNKSLKLFLRNMKVFYVLPSLDVVRSFITLFIKVSDMKSRLTIQIRIGVCNDERKWEMEKELLL